jgi:hypothetical protein
MLKSCYRINTAVLVHRVPKPAAIAVDRDRYFIEVPLVAPAQRY